MMNTFIPYASLFVQGIAVTVAVWIIASCVSILMGTVCGIISCRYSVWPSFGAIIGVYTFVAKGIPAYVQILIAYFIIPSLLGMQIPGFIAATAALAFCSSGYVTEIVRAGLNAVPAGQWDACAILGYSFGATMWRIIMPQAFANIAPALFGECEQLLKSTSLLATIGITELTRTGMNIISRELNPMPVYLAIACIYLLFSAFLNIASRYVEGRLNGQR